MHVSSITIGESSRLTSRVAIKNNKEARGCERNRV